MMVFDAEGKKQYVHHAKNIASGITSTLGEKQAPKQTEKASAEIEKKTTKKKGSIKM